MIFSELDLKLRYMKSPTERMSSSGAPKQLLYNVVSPVNHNHSEREWQELAKQARGETPVKPL